MCSLVTVVQTCARPISGDEPGQSLGNSQTCMNDKQQSDQHRHHEREARQTFMISSPDEPERIGKSFHRSIRAPSGDCHVGQMDYGRGVSLREVRWHYFRSEEHTSALQPLMRTSYAV